MRRRFCMRGEHRWHGMSNRTIHQHCSSNSAVREPGAAAAVRIDCIEDMEYCSSQLHENFKANPKIAFDSMRPVRWRPQHLHRVFISGIIWSNYLSPSHITLPFLPFLPPQSSLTPSAGVILSYLPCELFSEKKLWQDRLSGIPDGENRVILCSFVSPQYQLVTDGQRDQRMVPLVASTLHGIWRCAAARKKSPLRSIIARKIGCRRRSSAIRHSDKVRRRVAN